MGNGGQIFPPNPNRFFALQKCELGTFDRKRFDILNDFRIIYDMAKVTEEAESRKTETNKSKKRNLFVDLVFVFFFA